MRTRHFILGQLVFGTALSVTIPQHSNATDAHEQPSAPVVAAIRQAHDLHFEYSRDATAAVSAARHSCRPEEVRCDSEPSHIRPKIIVEALLPISGIG